MNLVCELFLLERSFLLQLPDLVLIALLHGIHIVLKPLAFLLQLESVLVRLLFFLLRLLLVILELLSLVPTPVAQLLDLPLVLRVLLLQLEIALLDHVGLRNHLSVCLFELLLFTDCKLAHLSCLVLLCLSVEVFVTLLPFLKLLRGSLL